MTKFKGNIGKLEIVKKLNYGVRLYLKVQLITKGDNKRSKLRKFTLLDHKEFEFTRSKSYVQFKKVAGPATKSIIGSSNRAAL